MMESKVKSKVGGGFVFDYVDPSSGVLMKSENPNAVYYESLGVDHYLKQFKSVQVGMCRVIDHPVYGLDCYPASMFTSIKDQKLLSEILDEVINEININ